MFKRTKIVATVGPSSGSREVLESLIASGVDVFRINFSHGDEAQRATFLREIRAAEQAVGRPVAICGDLCGPKIRVGMILGGAVDLQTGREIIVQRTPLEGTSERISTTLAELVDIVRVGNTILLADGRLRFEVLGISPPDEFTCRVIVGGMLSSGKGVNLPDADLHISALTEKDRQDVQWIAQHDFDYVALSFVQRGKDVDELRSLLDQHGSEAHIIAKIEKPRAIDQIDAIIEKADAVMVARGDLGVEMDFPVVPIAQKKIAQKCQATATPCIIATEMLESMITSTRPTRAEVSDVANAVFDNADAVMLSAESAVGEHPVAAVDAMRRIVTASEEYLDQNQDNWPRTVGKHSRTAALAASVRQIMQMQKIAAIATFTAAGRTARLLSKNRPPCPILAMSSEAKVARRTCLYYGVVPHVIELPDDVDQLLETTNTLAKQQQLATTSDRIAVLTAHPIGTPDGTRGLIVEDVT